MLKVDLHTHILPEKWPDWTRKSGYPGWVFLEHHGPGCARMMKSDGAGARPFREIMANCWDPHVRLEDMDRARVGTQVLSTVPVMFSYWAKAKDAYDLGRLLNDHIAEVCRAAPRVVEGTPDSLAKPRSLGVPPGESLAGRGTQVVAAPAQVGRAIAVSPAHPVTPSPLQVSRFLGLGTLPMQDPDLACRELERCVKELGLRGVQIGSHVERPPSGPGGDWNLDEPAVVQVLAEAERLGACVFVHPWDMMGKEEMPRYFLPWLVGMPAEGSRAICSVIFGGVLDRLPRLRIGFAHGGGSFPGTIGRIEQGYKVRPDLCAARTERSPREYLAQRGNGVARPARFYVDSLVHDPDALRLILRLFGAERVALGSDYPFPLGEHEPGSLIESMDDLDLATRERLLRATALEFLGL